MRRQQPTIDGAGARHAAQPHRPFDLIAQDRQCALGAGPARGHAVYDALPADLKQRLDGMTATHDFEKFRERMRRDKGSARPPLTGAQRAAKPPVSQPLFLTHPITGRRVLYCNPGYAIRINELPPMQSDEMLTVLFEHRTQERFRYKFNWVPRTVLMGDNMGTIHNAVADYKSHEHRLIKRCPVAANRFFAAA